MSAGKAPAAIAECERIDFSWPVEASKAAQEFQRCHKMAASGSVLSQMWLGWFY